MIAQSLRREASLFQATRCLHLTRVLLKSQRVRASSPAPKPRTSANSSTSAEVSKATESVPATSTEAPKSITEKIKDLWATAKYLFKFYFNGVKQIWADRKRVAEVQERIRSGGDPLTRAEAQLVRIHKADLRKLPLFLFILLILEEALPLVVIWAPSLLPSTCILPSQAAKIRLKQELVRAQAFKKLHDLPDVLALAPVVKKQNVLPPSKAEEDVFKALQGEGLTQLAKLFSLSTLGGSSLIRRRLTKHLAYIQEDDAMMRASPDGIPQNAEDVARALAERGLRATELPHREMYESLRAWLNCTSKELAGNTAALLPLRLYIPRSIEEIEASLEAEKKRGLLEKTKDVVNEVVEEEKRVLDRDQRSQEEVKRKQDELEQSQRKHKN